MDKIDKKLAQALQADCRRSIADLADEIGRSFFSDWDEIKNMINLIVLMQKMGIDIPNMCWHDELEHFTSCMLCLVKDESNGKLFPSCSVKATNNLEVVTENDEIKEARQTALELLLSEHVGDCEAPCQIACPAHMDIPQMNRLIAAGKFDEALKVVKKDIAYHGDVLNTTARIQDQCNTLQQKLLVSKALFKEHVLKSPLKSVEIGDVHLKGKIQTVALYGIQQ